MKAHDRDLNEWYSKIKHGEIRLPRFQRFESWDKHRISSLVHMVIHDLPLGITLVLNVGEEEKFISRYLKTAPKTDNRIHEYLLDGQQRLTALWRVLHNNYEWETFYAYFKCFDNYDKDEEREDMSVYFRGRYEKQNGTKYPLWCDDPAHCLKRGFIPTHLLRPEDIQSEIDEWIEKATAPLRPKEDFEKLEKFLEYKKAISDEIKDLRSIIFNYNLPYLSLPAKTDKTVALDIFINMNTNSKPLSTYDIIVAEVESVMGESLHNLQEALEEKNGNISRYSDLSNLLLNTSALLQDRLPNQRGAWDMDKRRMVDNWDTMTIGLSRMAAFLRNEGIYDQQRLPTNAVLAVIAALYSYIPESGDILGQDELLLKRYMWHSFFTDRYENAAATHAFYDFMGLKRVILGESDDDGNKHKIEDIPIFKEHSIVEIEELLTAEWPKGSTIRGRAILAVLCRLGAFDFSTGEKLDVYNIEKRHYHHLYPDALLKEAKIDSYIALNCSLITDKTNMSIGRKDPLVYMKDRYKWTSEEIVDERLQSHLIPIPELSNGGYEGLDDNQKVVKLKNDFNNFISRRAELVMKAANLLIDGHQLSAAELYKD